MKVVHLIYTGGISGAEKYLMDLLPGLREQGIETHLIVVSPASAAASLADYCGEMRKQGVPLLQLTSSKWGYWGTARRIARYLKEEKIHFLHAHLFNADFLAALVKQFFYRDVYLLSTKHGYSEKTLQEYTGDNFRIIRDLYYYITKYTLGKIDTNLSISKGISHLYRNLQLTRDFFPVIPHGISINRSRLKENDPAYRRSAHQLVIVGRLEEFKGHHYLLEALPELIQSFPDLQLLVLGAGSRMKALKEQAARLGVAAHVEFLGFQPDPYSYIINSDVIVLPSAFEPFGLVFIESFALKVPVVAFDTPAGNEIMTHQETGLLAPRNNSRALAAHIIQLLQDPEERKRIAANAFRRYEEYYNTGRMVKDTASFYRQLPQ